jgi:hypothetical protein
MSPALYIAIGGVVGAILTVLAFPPAVYWLVRRDERAAERARGER